MFNKPISELTLADIESLVENGVPESRILDYKLKLPGKSDSDRKEFLGDVTSFANTLGGYIIYGIKEEKGIAVGVEGFETDNIDDDMLRLENLIRDGIEPRIIGYKINYLKLDNGKYILILQIPKSILAPHWVSFKKSYKFYIRNTSGKSYMSLDQLRLAFSESAEISKKFAEFRAERIANVYSEELSIGNLFLDRNQLCLLLHIVPLDSLTMEGFRKRIDIENCSNLSSKLRPIFSDGWDHRYSVEGYYTFSRERDSNKIYSYTCLFYNGVIEAFGMLFADREGKYLIIQGKSLESYVLRSVYRYLSVMFELNINSPLIIALTLLNSKGLKIVFPFGYTRDTYPSSLDTVILPELLVENSSEIPYLKIPKVESALYEYEKLPTYQNAFNKLAQALRPILDSSWNMCGVPRSPFFDNQNNWKLARETADLYLKGW